VTAAGHLAEAEHLLQRIHVRGHEWDDAALLACALEAIGHALVALAVETGVPHTPESVQAAGGG
jgi:hypothetical protein